MFEFTLRFRRFSRKKASLLAFLCLSSSEFQRKIAPLKSEPLLSQGYSQRDLALWDKWPSFTWMNCQKLQQMALIKTAKKPPSWKLLCVPLLFSYLLKKSIGLFMKISNPIIENEKMRRWCHFLRIINLCILPTTCNLLYTVSILFLCPIVCLCHHTNCYF